METLLNYSFAADIATMILVVTMIVIINSAFSIKSLNMHLIVLGSVFIGIAATISVLYHYILFNVQRPTIDLMYCLNGIVKIMLIASFIIYIMYFLSIVNSTGFAGKVVLTICVTSAIFFVVVEIVQCLCHTEASVNRDLGITNLYSVDLFNIFYLAYCAVVLIGVLIFYKNFIKRVRVCLLVVLLISVGIGVLQIHMQTATFVCFVFILPVIAVLYFFHNNAYHVSTGTLDEVAFEAYLGSILKSDFTLIALRLYDMTSEKNDALDYSIIRRLGQKIKGGYFFKVSNSRFAFLFNNEKNPSVDDIINDEFVKLVNDLRGKKYEFKIIRLTSVDQDKLDDDDVNDTRLYERYVEYLVSKTRMNGHKRATDKDFERFLKEKYILSELKDIYDKRNLEDPRVIVYGQPILNTKTGQFGTAEVLMRLKLDKYGLIYPDQFIPLCEKYKYIHVFTEIVLNKTCQAIKSLESMGKAINTISVNIASEELKNPHFCNDMVSIIQVNGVNYEKIAFEITESETFKDYDMAKKIMREIKEYGIKVYLDDFGTGYSNFVRILDLPIDVIKFDRSMTIMSSKNEESFFMVQSFSDVFRKSDYKILFEGVEDDEDESRCSDMNAMYLQGFKYSRPIPIERLGEFLEEI